MNYSKRSRLRILGKILFIFYIGFIIYFLLFSDWYGRSVEGMQEYRYNLVLFKEIKRFWQYREQLGAYAMFTNLFGNVLIFVPFWIFHAYGEQVQELLLGSFLQFCAERFCVETFQLFLRKWGALMWMTCS